MFKKFLNKVSPKSDPSAKKDVVTSTENQRSFDLNNTEAVANDSRVDEEDTMEMRSKRIQDKLEDMQAIALELENVHRENHLPMNKSEGKFTRSKKKITDLFNTPSKTEPELTDKPQEQEYLIIKNS